MSLISWIQSHATWQERLKLLSEHLPQSISRATAAEIGLPRRFIKRAAALERVLQQQSAAFDRENVRRALRLGRKAYRAHDLLMHEVYTYVSGVV